MTMIMMMMTMMIDDDSSIVHVSSVENILKRDKKFDPLIYLLSTS